MVCVLKIKYYKQTKNNSLPAEKPRTNVARRHNSGPLHVNSINYIAVFFFAFLSLDTLHVHFVTSRFFNISVLKCLAEEALLKESRT